MDGKVIVKQVLQETMQDFLNALHGEVLTALQSLEKRVAVLENSLMINKQVSQQTTGQIELVQTSEQK
jgi:hypothetical protein